jgi:hypothetical protein
VLVVACPCVGVGTGVLDLPGNVRRGRVDDWTTEGTLEVEIEVEGDADVVNLELCCDGATLLLLDKGRHCE